MGLLQEVYTFDVALAIGIPTYSDDGAVLFEADSMGSTGGNGDDIGPAGDLALAFGIRTDSDDRAVFININRMIVASCELRL